MTTYRENSGLLGVNDRKEKETHPDYNGKLFVTKPGLYYLKGWKKTTKSGSPMLSLAADYAPEDKQAEAKGSFTPSTPSTPSTPTIDDVPF
jgi:hypothetical protein